MLRSEGRVNWDFLKFWSGQTISNLGSSVSMFAIPLLVFKLTGSPLNLGLAVAAEYLPYPLFGLLLGALVDRLNRKRLMIATDLLRAALVASIPILADAGVLSVWWIYLVAFLSSVLKIAFDSAEFAAIPSLVKTQGDLVTANGRIQASYNAGMVVGPFLGGATLVFVSLSALFWIDAATYVVSAVSLALVRIAFSVPDAEERRSRNLMKDVWEGLSYVLRHPVLRLISLMMAMVNFASNAAQSQDVLLLQRQLHASDSQVGYFFAVGSAGVVITGLLAGRLRRRWSFSQVALGALMLSGFTTMLLGLVTAYWMALVVIAIGFGFGVLFNINTGSLRQAIVPNHLLGRIISIAGVLAWSAIPLGSITGGVVVEYTRNVRLIYIAVGIVTMVIPLIFAFTPLGHADRYIRREGPASEPPPGTAPEPS